MSTSRPPKGRPLAQSRVEAARTGPRIPLFAVAVAVLVVVLVVGGVTIALVGGEDDDTAGRADPATAATSPAAGDQAFGAVSVEGEPLPPFPESGEDPAVGMEAPTLVSETPAGEPITVDPADGPMVIAFVAHWCPHCQAEVPRLVEMADDEGRIGDLDLVAVATGSDPSRGRFPPGEWLAEEGWPGPVLLDTEPEGTVPVAQQAYGVSGYPFLVVVDGDGTVVARTSGELGEDGLRDLVAEASAAG